MKKHFQFLAATFITVAFISCSKEKIETPELNPQAEEATSINSQRSGGEASFGSLPISTKNMEAWYQFNSDLKDASNKLAPATPTTPGADLYTSDRKGMRGKAIRFTGQYGLKIASVPSKSKMSVAAWVKFQYDTIPTFHIVRGNNLPTLGQDKNRYYGAISTPATTSVQSAPMDNKWHHLVATYDETNLRFYVDGVYVGSSFNPTTPWWAAIDYYVATTAGSSFWTGSMDDLVIFTRVLSATEVQKLYNIYF
jgi:hypothetical protein